MPHVPHMPLPPFDELSKYIDYDASAGIGVWRVSRGSAKQGKTVGFLTSEGYINVRYKNKNYVAHRLFWLLHTRQDPKSLTVDHIDRNRSNNKFSNLRLATYTEQQYNRDKQINNSTGYAGVCWKKNIQKYRARITIDSKEVHLGYYSSLEQAVAIRRAKELEIYGEFSPLHRINNDQQLILDNNNQQLSLLGHPSF